MTKPPRLGKSTLPVPYEVGYGRPPAETRFRKGQSGNPKGRPKGARNKMPALHEERLKDIVLAEAYRDIKVHDGDRQVDGSMAQAVMRSLALNAAQKASIEHRSSSRTCFIALRRHARPSTMRGLKMPSSTRWNGNANSSGASVWGSRHPNLCRIRRYRDRHEDRDGKLPWPVTKDQHAAWVWLAERREAAEEEIQLLRQDLAEEKDEQVRRFIEDQIAHETKFREKIIGTIGIWPNRVPMAINRHRASREHQAISMKRCGVRARAGMGPEAEWQFIVILKRQLQTPKSGINSLLVTLSHKSQGAPNDRIRLPAAAGGKLHHGPSQCLCSGKARRAVQFRKCQSENFRAGKRVDLPMCRQERAGAGMEERLREATIPLLPARVALYCKPKGQPNPHPGVIEQFRMLSAVHRHPRWFAQVV